MPGAPGAPGAAGGAAGGTFVWKTYPPPAELTVTYDQWLAQTGNKRAALPAPFLIDDQTKQPAKLTPNEWFQLQRIYGERGAEVKGPVPGRVGTAMMKWFDPWAATKVTEAKALIAAYTAGLKSFTFEVGFPVSAGMTFDPSTASVTQVNNIIIPVIMRVRPSAQKRYGELVYQKLKRFDCWGHGRDTGSSVVNSSAAFSIVTARGGFWQPRVLRLEPEMGAIWGALWSANQIKLTLYDRQNKEIASATQSAGHGAGILGDILYPNKIYYSPRYKMLIPPEGRKFGGGKWQISGTKGWVYAFSFSMPAGDARRIDHARVQYVGVKNPMDLARGHLASATMPAPPSAGGSSGGAAAGAGAPGEAGGPGAPGGPGAMPGAPPGMAPPGGPAPGAPPR